MEIGEPISVPFESPENEKKKNEKGHLKVTVVNVCNGVAIKDADVSFSGNLAFTDYNGVAVFNDIPVKKYKVWAEKYYDDADYLEFIIVYPKIAKHSLAKDKASTSAEIEDQKTNEITIKLKVYRCVEKIVLKRKHIEITGEDKYGHWWTEIDDVESYGWWPKYPMGDPSQNIGTRPIEPKHPGASANVAEKVAYYSALAVYEVKEKMYAAQNHPLTHTLRGVEGELNGQTSFWGTSTRDPHHGDDKSDGVKEMYQPVLDDCRADADIKTACRNFARAYAKKYGGQWSWRFEAGNHCHTFQVRLLDQCKLKKFKEL